MESWSTPVLSLRKSCGASVAQTHGLAISQPETETGVNRQNQDGRTPNLSLLLLLKNGHCPFPFSVCSPLLPPLFPCSQKWGDEGGFGKELGQIDCENHDSWSRPWEVPSC
ncbi:hypothetical protein QQF64_003773 [Cirrhinus molitorella]|uniref:Uncharacterized protein n=1 Tax=Cirrhinus molitorella TaxID=172907 RepID=A0ABR3MMA7_9TELE